MQQTVDKQRCFVIPRKKLDLFLIRLFMDSSSMLRLEAKYIFEADSEYFDVVVNMYGSYPYVENQLEKFIEEL